MKLYALVLRDGCVLVDEQNRLPCCEASDGYAADAIRERLGEGYRVHDAVFVTDTGRGVDLTFLCFPESGILLENGLFYIPADQLESVGFAPTALIPRIQALARGEGFAIYHREEPYGSR